MFENSTQQKVASFKEVRKIIPCQFRCQICYEQYSKRFRYPISLNCGHTFCLACVRKLGNNRATIQCSICRKNTYSDYRKLGKNITLLELLESNGNLENDEHREPTTEEREALEKDARPQHCGFGMFFSNSDLEEFYDELHFLEDVVLQVHFNRQIRSLHSIYSTHLSTIRSNLEAIVQQFRATGNSFQELRIRLNAIRDEMTRQVSVIAAEQPEHAFSRALAARFYENYDSTAHRSPSPDRVLHHQIRPFDTSSSDEDDFRGANLRRRSRMNQNVCGEETHNIGRSVGNFGINNRPKNHLRVRPRFINVPIQQIVSLPDTSSSSQQQQQEDNISMWGSSSGWGSSNSDVEEDKQDETLPAAANCPSQKQQKGSNSDVEEDKQDETLPAAANCPNQKQQKGILIHIKKKGKEFLTK